jgi:predicted RNA-binding Zn-ribbon protein involved in translation (DUF1610 family)
MSLHVDMKYINLVSSSLEKFKWKKNNLANCRCPLCGDSESNRTKARGYFFAGKDSYFYKCHNCGAAHNVYKFLEIVSPSLFKEYCLETWINKKEDYPQVEFVLDVPEPKIYSYTTIDELPHGHKVLDFLKTRRIPEKRWTDFYYAEHFSDLAKEINSKYNLIDDERVVIPVFDEHNQLIGVQGRSFGNVKPRYITIKKDDNIRMTYGLNNINRSKEIFVVEGPIDSMFLDNGIACMGSGNFLEIRERLQNDNLIFVLDNEPRNRNTVDILKQLIENNEKVVIWPSFIRQKDINDMVLSDIDAKNIIQENTYSGAAAMLAFNSWRKC